MTQAELIAAVRAHAEANYEKDGWDFLVECWSDAEIVETIGGAKTAAGAVAKCARVVRSMASYRSDIMNA